MDVDVARVTVCKSKLQIKCTEASIAYEGSVYIDHAFMNAGRISAFERLQVWNVSTGAEFVTYAVPAPAGSRIVRFDGSAARRVQPGDTVVITTFAEVDPYEVMSWKPAVLCIDPFIGGPLCGSEIVISLGETGHV